MMHPRTVCFLAIVSFSLFLTVFAVPPNTPSDGDSSAETQCMLDSLLFSNGFELGGNGFYSNVFHYECHPSSFPISNTQVYPHTLDSGSSVEVSFNGAPLNFRTMNNAISNGGPNGQAPNSPEFHSQTINFIYGMNTIVLGVGCNGGGVPVPCYYQYTITCFNPRPDTPGGQVVGDPQFIGLRGQDYQVHGVSGEIYNIVSDSDLQYNSRFVFLDAGECPVIDGKKQKSCWSHPGSYLGEIGLKTKSGERIHLVTGNAKKGFALIEVNSKPMQVGDSILLADDMGSVSYNSTHLASVTIGNWDFQFENSDMFVNQKVKVFDSRGLRSHGLLGQTWRETTYPNTIKYIQGTVDDYVIREGDIFGDNFVFNTYN